MSFPKILAFRCINYPNVSPIIPAWGLLILSIKNESSIARRNWNRAIGRISRLKQLPTNVVLTTAIPLPMRSKNLKGFYHRITKQAWIPFRRRVKPLLIAHPVLSKLFFQTLHTPFSNLPKQLFSARYCWSPDQQSLYLYRGCRQHSSLSQSQY